MLSKRLQNSENYDKVLNGYNVLRTEAATSFRPAAGNFIKKEILAQVFSCEFCEISKNAFFTEHLWWLLL